MISANERASDLLSTLDRSMSRSAFKWLTSDRAIGKMKHVQRSNRHRPSQA